MAGPLAVPTARDDSRQRRLLLPWILLAVALTGLMWLWPGDEVVPYHLIWISFALTYGFAPWPVGRTVAILGVLTALTGAILIYRAANGVLAWEETAEIPLMWLLSLLLVWHVQRREAALTTVTRLARNEIASAERRVRLGRLTSHEMRTPLTIALGYVDLLLAQEQDEERRADLEVVRDELGRLSRAGQRLLRMIQLREILDRSTLDIDELVRETTQRWATVADRCWVVDTRGGSFQGSSERVRACLDTLIENALRYTEEGGVVRVLSFRRDDHLWLGVADSGPGFAPDLAGRVNSHVPGSSTAQTSHDALDVRSQTGLGIGLVQEIVEARGGRVCAGRSREGGALVLLLLPLRPTDSVYGT